MRRQAPVRGVPKRGKPSLNPVRGKGRGRGKVAPLPSPIRGIKRPGKGKGKVAPLPMPPKRGKPKASRSSAKKATPTARQARRVG